MKLLRYLSRELINSRKRENWHLTDDAQDLLLPPIDEKAGSGPVITSTLDEKDNKRYAAVGASKYGEFNSSDDWTHHRLLSICEKFGYQVESIYAAHPIYLLVNVLQVTLDKAVSVWPDFLYLGMIAGAIVEGLEIKPDTVVECTITEQLTRDSHVGLDAMQAFWAKCRPTSRSAACSTPESRYISGEDHFTKSDEMNHQKRLELHAKPPVIALCVPLRFNQSSIVLEIPMVELEAQQILTNSIYLSEYVEYGMFHQCQRKDHRLDGIGNSEKFQAGFWGRRITPDELGFSRTCANSERRCYCEDVLGSGHRDLRPHKVIVGKDSRLACMLERFSRWLRRSN